MHMLIVLFALLGSPFTPSMKDNPPSAVSREDHRGCCSHHRGVCGCYMGRVRCCDGTLSPTCTCDEHHDPR